MDIACSSRSSRHQHRGAVSGLSLIVLPVTFGFAALSVDTGYLYMTRAELQNVADAAALAGASAYGTDAGLKQDWTAVTQIARERAQTVALKNPVLRRDLVLADADVSLGQHSFASPTGPLLVAEPWNAVQTTARRTRDSANGPVPLFFASIFGRRTKDLVASARAVADDRASGFDLRHRTNILPFTLPEEQYYDSLRNGQDILTYNSGVIAADDGVREVVMYPCRDQAPGNFGILDMGRVNDGATYVTNQIMAGGATPAELEATFGTSELVFYDADHTAATGPRTYPVSGTPGMKISIGRELANHIGEVCGFFLNRGAVDNGTNATYQISGVVFCRILVADLGSHPVVGDITTTGLVVQPVPFDSGWVMVNENAPCTNGTLGRISLVQ